MLAGEKRNNTAKAINEIKSWSKMVDVRIYRRLDKDRFAWVQERKKGLSGVLGSAVCNSLKRTNLVDEILTTCSDGEIPIGCLGTIMGDLLEANEPFVRTRYAMGCTVLEGFFKRLSLELERLLGYAVEWRADGDGDGGDGEETRVGFACEHGDHPRDLFIREQASNYFIVSHDWDRV